MKRLITSTCLLAGICCISHAQIRVGIRDNKFVGASYTYKSTWSAKLEESVFQEDLPYQYIRGYIGYEAAWKKLGVKISPYIGTQWNGNFQDYGTQLTITFKVFSWISLFGTLNPHKDTSLGYLTCYELGGQLRVNESLCFLLNYRNIPEYRATNKRIRLGVAFSEGRLYVAPCLSIPTDESIKNTRLLINFEWTFKKAEK